MSSYPLTGTVKRLVLTSACVLTFCAVSITSTYAQTTTQPPADSTQPATPGAMTIEQTLSDEGQRNTIAFSALSFLSGSLGSDSFFPPGKVADFWGFQYMRDNDPSQKGHNTDFLTKAANNMLAVLNDSQEAQLITLAESQVDSINQYAYKRFLLMKAFRRQLEGDIPTGSTGLDETAVKTYSAQLYHLDGEISFQRATVMGGILASLDATQRATLDAIKGKGMLEWPDVGDQLDPQKYSHDVHVAVMTYAGDLFSWYLGSIEADVYFAPERQGTYFGSFYMKDAPAMGNPDYTISSTLTGDYGQKLLSLLTTDQALLLTSLVDSQREFLQGIVDTREAVSTELRKFIAGGTADSATVLSLMDHYGELDGEIVYQYATHFAQVGQSLTDAQQTQVDNMRNTIMGSFSSPPAGAFLYSNAIAMPEIPDTDFLFGIGTEPTDTEMTTATPTDTGTTTTPSTTETETTTTTPTSTMTVTYPVVDTGQTKCYDNATESTCPAAGASFYGQDAQYAGNQPNYTLSSDSKTVYDNNTGLTWMRGPNTTLTTPVKADKMTYTAAKTWVTTVNGMSYGGYSDWRLPTIKELYSLIQFNGTDPSGYTDTDTSALTPFIDSTKFNFAYGETSSGERIIDSQYASSNVYVLDPSDSGYTKLFGVNFADGRIKGYDLKMPDGSEKTFFVQLVRGNTNYGVNNFTDNGDQTVTDSATGLMWSKPDSASGLNWQDALAFVQTKNAENYLGHNDWRLPNVKELQSILDYTKSPDTTSSAAINPIFTVTQITNEGGNVDYPWYWANTTHAAYNGMGAGAYVAFGRAGGWQKATPTATCYTLYDVHGAGAQRSDPKTTSGISTVGEACNGGTAYGHGPQGDVQRAANYVRLVRDATSSTSPTPTETETTTPPTEPTTPPATTETETTTPPVDTGTSTPPVTTETGTTTPPDTGTTTPPPVTETTTPPDTGTTTSPPVTETGTTTPTDTGTTTLPPVTETGTTTPPVDTTGTETTTTTPPTTDTGTTPTTPPVVTPVTTPSTPATTTTVASSVTNCTGSSTLGGTCNAGGNTITVTEVKASGHLANGTLNSTLTSQGWVSNITITAKGKLVGGVVTGYIKNEGVMMDFVFKGASIIGGTLGGTIQNDSVIKGFFKDVTLLANTKITGGVLKGTIQGDKKAPALLTKLTIKAGSHLSGVKLGDGVKVEKGVVIEETTDTTTPTTPTVTLPTLGQATATDAKGQPVTTQTQMAGGISLDGKTFKPTGEAKQLSDSVDLTGRIQADPTHVKQKVKVFVTLTYQASKDSAEKFFFKLSAAGGLLPWTEGDLASLKEDSFQSDVTLPATLDVTMYHGLLLATGVVNVTFGYLLEDGTAVQSPQPVELTVTE